MSDTVDVPTVLIESVRASLPNAFPFLTSVQELIPVAMGDAPTNGMVSVIGLVGDYVWSFALQMPQPTVEAMCTAFTGFEFPYDSPETGDMVGELANVFAGEVSAQLSSRGKKAQLGLPTVTRGHDIELILRDDQPFERLQFSSDQGRFAIKIMLAASSSHSRDHASAHLQAGS